MKIVFWLSFVFIVLPVVLISVVASMWKFRRIGVKVVVLVAHIITSVLLIILVPVEALQLSIIVLGPGVLIVLIRLGTAVYDRARSRRIQSRRNPEDVGL